MVVVAVVVVFVSLIVVVNSETDEIEGLVYLWSSVNGNFQCLTRKALSTAYSLTQVGAFWFAVVLLLIFVTRMKG